MVDSPFSYARTPAEDPGAAKAAADVCAACCGLDRGPHPARRFRLAGPLALDPTRVQRLTANLAFLVAVCADGSELELIAKYRDGFLAPLDIDVLCSACSAIEDVVVFPEVDTDTGARLYFHVVQARCLPDARELPDPAHRTAAMQAEQHNAPSAEGESVTAKHRAGVSTAAKWGGANNKDRASVFVRWLLDTYPLPWLCTGVGVLDVLVSCCLP